jgi:replication-associated recombination protein RarA
MPEHEVRTVRGYDFYEAASALQKAIRRADARLAGYFAIELHESRFGEYVWRRLLTVSAEDCAGIVTREIWALYQSWQLIRKRKPEGGRIFMAKAVILLCQHPKSRDADHLTNFVYDRQLPPDADIEAALEEARKDRPSIPAYAFDVHTAAGRARGATRKQFFRDEHDALQPRLPGFFDDIVP